MNATLFLSEMSPE